MKRRTKEKSQRKSPRHRGGKAHPPRVKKPCCFKKGTVALREIRNEQQSVKLLIRKKPFSRLTKEIAQDHISDCRYTGMALLAEQEATEEKMIKMTGHANEAALHAGRVTVKIKDL